MVQSERISGLAERYESFYLYEEREILERTGRLKTNFPQIDFLYSIKCNSNPYVLESVFRQGFGADAASLGEVLLAERAGLPRERIFFSAPGKTLRDIRGALTRATLIADSTAEIRRIQTAAEQAGVRVRIGLRINPDFSFSGAGGQPSKFGVDEAQALAFLREFRSDNVAITGLHIHLKSQELEASALSAYYGNVLRLAGRFGQVCGPLEYVNLGSGMGIPYSGQDRPLDLEGLGAALRE